MQLPPTEPQWAVMQAYINQEQERVCRRLQEQIAELNMSVRNLGEQLEKILNKIQDRDHAEQVEEQEHVSENEQVQHAEKVEEQQHAEQVDEEIDSENEQVQEQLKKSGDVGEQIESENEQAQSEGSWENPGTWVSHVATTIELCQLRTDQ